MRYKGRTYWLTGLCFVLCPATRIMMKNLKTVLRKRKVIEATMNSNIDDILVDKTVVLVPKVLEHLPSF